MKTKMIELLAKKKNYYLKKQNWLRESVCVRASMAVCVFSIKSENYLREKLWISWTNESANPAGLLSFVIFYNCLSLLKLTDKIQSNSFKCDTLRHFSLYDKGFKFTEIFFILSKSNVVF